MYTEVLEFYLLTITSFIETSAPIYSESLRQVFIEDRQFCRWLAETWLPGKVARGRQLRSLIQKQWPELDWEKAYVIYFRQIFASIHQGRPSGTRARIALSHSVSERKSAMLAAALANARPLCLQASLLQAISTEALRSCVAFRETHERYAGWQQRGEVARHAIHPTSRTKAGPMEIELAFAAIQQSWKNAQNPLAGNYQDFHRGAEDLLRQWWPIKEARRFMFLPSDNLNAFTKETEHSTQTLRETENLAELLTPQAA